MNLLVASYPCKSVDRSQHFYMPMKLYKKIHSFIRYAYTYLVWFLLLQVVPFRRLIADTPYKHIQSCLEKITLIPAEFLEINTLYYQLTIGGNEKLRKKQFLCL